ncbi:MAG: prepilin-type N-terminal cleavage/methylation domain-containing protein [Pyrinomonadaceae bacterium]
MKHESKSSRGFSVIELLVVLAVISIVAGYAVYSMSASQLYNTDEQAYLVLDYVKEARQRAITQKETIRVELNKDLGKIRLINENGPDTADDDVVIKEALFSSQRSVIFDRPPANIDSFPTAVTPIPALEFRTSLHPQSLEYLVGTLRFMPDGSVRDAGLNARGTDATVRGATIYFWMPEQGEDGHENENGDVIRAITVLGSSGNSEYLKCPVEHGECDAWK